jgi:hypothetical protein
VGVEEGVGAVGLGQLTLGDRVLQPPVVLELVNFSV